jgi:hypothetical protein
MAKTAPSESAGLRSPLYTPETMLLSPVLDVLPGGFKGREDGRLGGDALRPGAEQAGGFGLGAGEALGVGAHRGSLGLGESMGPEAFGPGACPAGEAYQAVLTVVPLRPETLEALEDITPPLTLPLRLQGFYGASRAP